MEDRRKQEDSRVSKPVRLTVLDYTGKPQSFNGCEASIRTMLTALGSFREYRRTNGGTLFYYRGFVAPAGFVVKFGA